MESPEINSYIYDQLIFFFTRVPKPLNNERLAFSTNVIGTAGRHIQKNEVAPLPHTVYRIYLNGLET